MRRVPLLVWSASLALSACSGQDGGLPVAYRRLTVPHERLDTAAARERGRALYLQNCALCHGVNGDGHGVRREGLSSPPRNFTDGTWQKRNSARRIFFTIREGVRGTSMSAWGSLSDADAWDLVAYIVSLGGRQEHPAARMSRGRSTDAFASGSPSEAKTILDACTRWGSPRRSTGSPAEPRMIAAEARSSL